MTPQAKTNIMSLHKFNQKYLKEITEGSNNTYPYISILDPYPYKSIFKRHIVHKIDFNIFFQFY